VSFETVRWRAFHLLFASLGLLVANCGRVGVNLLPVEPAHTLDSGSVDIGAADGGWNASDGAVVASDGGADSSASSEPAGTDASSEAGTDANSEAGTDASSDAGTDACIDTTADGVPNCPCDEASYVPDTSCGVGYCRSVNTPSACVAGVETACTAGKPRNSRDAICDGVDDNCNGLVDEDYAADSSCGQGYCHRTNLPSHCAAGVETSCTPGAPLSSEDATADGVDDDCDGQIDEDVCLPRTDIYRPGSFSFSPPKGCNTVTVKLWGGAGASGDGHAGYWANVTGGYGAAGGYTMSVMTVTAASVLQLYVGGGGKGCGAPGAGGIAAHSGGTGGTGKAQTGTPGADGSLSGGAGGNANSGGDGGGGSFGGGGGGAGTDPGFAPHGGGGGGGAATVLSVSGTTVIAGGGGGGGGAGSDVATAGHSGGNGGSGCSGTGVVATDQGGGGGGGGICQGQTTKAGTGRTPYDAASELTSGAARGGDANTDCQAGGDGYAVVSFSRLP
jgi:hypothetical protein